MDRFTHLFTLGVKVEGVPWKNPEDIPQEMLIACALNRLDRGIHNKEPISFGHVTTIIHQPEEPADGVLYSALPNNRQR